ncbi:LamG-like jellyroll fold domain-containing protein [Rhodopirellula halodulae]|uniref:LamG-like jellyroll fold domain-containing protein n=1 Tax=Rhodopirellula halodulae TaxID=2894198 RepID=UPI001E624DFB|nr:LamG-like jellyroll fold domain-containing protein [Rhodopirellula sp. JC737]MCC9658078.1 FecR domain-containing protein [Rhodopirellula sp. JC737]
MMNDTTIYDLIERHFIGELTEKQQRELRDALKANKKYRDRFRESALISAELRHLASELTIQPSVETRSKSSPAFRSGWLSIAIAATVLLALGGGLLFWRADLPATSSSIATLLDGYQYEFDAANAPASDEFGVGDYTLTQGAVTLLFENGVKVVVESPADFSLVSAMQMQLDRGRVRAVVPESGHGFVLATPQGNIEDLGTEFGVYVGADRDAELHVFAGEVNLLQQTQASQRFSEDTAVRLVSGNRERLTSTNDAAFATSAMIGYQRWQESQRQWREDPSTVLYFDFEDRFEHKVDARQTDGRSSRLADRKLAGNPNDGDVRGCIWATGRWSGKGALLFENADDRVELEIPGEFDAVTIMAWIQVNRLDNALQAVFNTRDWQAGEHHWNLLRDGAFRVGVSGAFARSCSHQRVPLGRWTHIAAVIDAHRGQAAYYIDGQRIDLATWQPNGPVRFGPTTLGSFGETSDDDSKSVTFSRDFRGRIDEFAVLRRLLSDEEIRLAYLDGNGFD